MEVGIKRRQPGMTSSQPATSLFAEAASISPRPHPLSVHTLAPSSLELQYLLIKGQKKSVFSLKLGHRFARVCRRLRSNVRGNGRRRAKLDLSRCITRGPSVSVREAIDRRLPLSRQKPDPLCG